MVGAGRYGEHRARVGDDRAAARDQQRVDVELAQPRAEIGDELADARDDRADRIEIDRRLATVAGEQRRQLEAAQQARALSHKSDIGGVVLNLGDETAVRRAFDAIAARVGAQAGAVLDGCLVQQMVVADAELIVGANWDEQFGPMLLVGIGGTLVELLKDVRLVPAPIDAGGAARLLRSLKLAPLLAGYRGKPPVDLDAVGAVIARISQLVANLGPRLRELDVNPLLVAGSHAIVADARAVLAVSTGTNQTKERP